MIIHVVAGGLIREPILKFYALKEFLFFLIHLMTTVYVYVVGHVMSCHVMFCHVIY